MARIAGAPRRDGQVSRIIAAAQRHTARTTRSAVLLYDPWKLLVDCDVPLLPGRPIGTLSGETRTSCLRQDVLDQHPITQS